MTNSVPRPAVPLWLRVVILLALLGTVWLSQRESETTNRVPPTANSSVSEVNAPSTSTPEQAPTQQPATTIADVVLKNASGKIIYRGGIDLQPTLDRIAQGQLFERFPHDGSIFQNREKRLPKHPAGYYKEYVVPTPGESGPGPQRLVVGKEGEVYYTQDHYHTFQRIR